MTTFFWEINFGIMLKLLLESNYTKWNYVRLCHWRIYILSINNIKYYSMWQFLQFLYNDPQFLHCSTTLPTHKYQTNPNQIIQIPTLSTIVNDPDSLITSWFCDCGVPLSNQNVTNEKGKENSRNWTKWIKFNCQPYKN